MNPGQETMGKFDSSLLGSLNPGLLQTIHASEDTGNQTSQQSYMQQNHIQSQMVGSHDAAGQTRPPQQPTQQEEEVWKDVQQQHLLQSGGEGEGMVSTPMQNVGDERFLRSGSSQLGGGSILGSSDGQREPLSASSQMPFQVMSSGSVGSINRIGSDAASLAALGLDDAPSLQLPSMLNSGSSVTMASSSSDSRVADGLQPLTSSFGSTPTQLPLPGMSRQGSSQLADFLPGAHMIASVPISMNSSSTGSLPSDLLHHGHTSQLVLSSTSENPLISSTGSNPSSAVYQSSTQAVNPILLQSVHPSSYDTRALEQQMGALQQQSDFIQAQAQLRLLGSQQGNQAPQNSMLHSSSMTATTAAGGKPQTARRRRRDGPNYKPLDEIRLFGKMLSFAINSRQRGRCRKVAPQYFKKGDNFAVANGAHRPTVERDVYDLLRPLLFESYKAEREQADIPALEEVWWNPTINGQSSPFEGRREGFGVELGQAVLHNAGVPDDIVTAAVDFASKFRKQPAAIDTATVAGLTSATDSAAHISSSAGAGKRKRGNQDEDEQQAILLQSQGQSLPTSLLASKPRTRRRVCGPLQVAVLAMQSTVPVQLRGSFSDFLSMKECVSMECFLGFFTAGDIALYRIDPHNSDGDLEEFDEHMFDVYASQGDPSLRAVTLQVSQAMDADDLPIWSELSQANFLAKDCADGLDVFAYSTAVERVSAASDDNAHSIFAPVCRLIFDGTSMEECGGIDLPNTIKVMHGAALQRHGGIASFAPLESPVSVHLYPLPDVSAKPDPGNGLNRPTRVFLTGYRPWLQRLSQPGHSLDELAKRALEEGAQQHNSDDSLSLDNVKTYEREGIVSFMVPHWTVYGDSDNACPVPEGKSSSSSPDRSSLAAAAVTKLGAEAGLSQANIDHGKSFTIEMNGEIIGSVQSSNGWEHLASYLQQIIGQDSMSDSMLMFWDDAFHSWLPATTWDDLDDGDRLRILPVEGAEFSNSYAEHNANVTSFTAAASTPQPSVESQAPAAAGFCVAPLVSVSSAGSMSANQEDHEGGSGSSAAAANSASLTSQDSNDTHCLAAPLVGEYLLKRTHAMMGLRWVQRWCRVDMGDASAQEPFFVYSATEEDSQEGCKLPLKGAQIIVQDRDQGEFKIVLAAGNAKHAQYEFRASSSDAVGMWEIALTSAVKQTVTSSTSKRNALGSDLAEDFEEGSNTDDVAASTEDGKPASASVPNIISTPENEEGPSDLSILPRRTASGSIKRPISWAFGAAAEMGPRSFKQYNEARDMRARQRIVMERALGRPSSLSLTMPSIAKTARARSSSMSEANPLTRSAAQ